MRECRMRGEMESLRSVVARVESSNTQHIKLDNTHLKLDNTEMKVRAPV